VGPNTAQFQVLNSGIYLITWTLNGVTSMDDTVNVRLFNVSTNTAIHPDPQETVDTTANIIFSISGQTIVRLAATRIIELRLNHSNTDPTATLTLLNPTFTITEISN